MLFADKLGMPKKIKDFSDLYKGNKILSNSQEKEPADYLTE